MRTNRIITRKALPILLVLVLMFSVIIVTVLTDPDRTDDIGGHYGPDGVYHFHHGYPPHQHSDSNQCPYEPIRSGGVSLKAPLSDSPYYKQYGSGNPFKHDPDSLTWLIHLLSTVLSLTAIICISCYKVDVDEKAVQSKIEFDSVHTVK